MKKIKNQLNRITMTDAKWRSQREPGKMRYAKKRGK